MSELPSGFVIDAKPTDLPAGFVIDGAQTEKKKFGLADTWPAKLATGLYDAAKSAVTLPGDVMTGKAQVPQSENMPGGESTKDIGRVVDMATLGSPMAPKASPTMAGKAVVPTTQELKEASKGGYNAARDLGVEIKPESVSVLGEKIGAVLNEKGVDATLAPKTFSILGKLANPPTESVATVSNLETLRRSLGHAAKDFANPTEQLAARRAMEHLDDYLAALPAEDVIRGSAPEASKILSEARGNYAAAKRSEQITEAAEAADLNAAAANSGQNIGNATRQRVKSILASDKKSAGYSPEELAQMERVVRGTKTGNLSRIAGNLMGGGGGLGAYVAGAGGYAATGNPLGLAIPVVGAGLKKISNMSTDRQIRILEEMTRARSPLAKSRPGPSVSSAEELKRAAIARAMMGDLNNQ
ncbi:hypothetical protein [Tardiphaga sp. 841_E9_N1_2]|uniref:hypothetical protein n=1 Tax=Tardiphaga sp. 841_E9_N1_2 TaxID=3240762 RepID=UPI003F24D8F7